MTQQNLLKILLLSSALLLPLSAIAASEDWGVNLSANVGLVSDYSFRGISQSDEGPAIQGGFDIGHESGLYAGVWGSNVDFNDGDQTSMEIDFYGGYGGTIGDVNYDIGAIYYAYPGADDNVNYDFWETSVALGYDFDVFAASASVNYSPDYFGGTGDAFYYSLNTDVPLPADFTLSAHVGHQTIEDNSTDYTDWSVGLGYSYEGFDLSVQYVDTDLNEPNECSDGCDSRVIFGVSRSF